jgi:hypothetical protein
VSQSGFCWLGSLRSLGVALTALTAVPDVSPVGLRVFAAAIASSHGYARALEQIVRPALDTHPGDGEVHRWSSALALRVIFGGQSTEAAISALVPDYRMHPAERHRRVWPPALLALRHFLNHGRYDSAVLLVAHLMSTEFRARLHEVSQSVATDPDDMLLSRIGAEPGAWKPWDGTGPRPRLDYAGLENIVAEYVGTTAPSVVWPAFFDPDVLAGVLFGITGHGVSACTRLLAPRRATRWQNAHTALRAAVNRRQPAPAAFGGWLQQQVADERLLGLLHNLEETPEPNVETGTPVDLLLQGQSSWALDMNRAGRGAECRVLRRLFGRPDLLQAHEPYWIGPCQRF